MSQTRFPFAPKNLPDGRVALYYPPRRAFVIVGQAEHGVMSRRQLLVIGFTMVLGIACLILWLNLARFGLRLALTATAAAALAAAIFERLVLRSSHDILMRAPFFEDAPPRLNFSQAYALLMSIVGDKRLRRIVIGMRILMVCSVIALVAYLLGFEDQTAKQKPLPWQGFVIFCVVYAIVEREWLRRKAKQQALDANAESLS